MTSAPLRSLAISSPRVAWLNPHTVRPLFGALRGSRIAVGLSFFGARHAPDDRVDVSALSLHFLRV